MKKSEAELVVIGLWHEYPGQKDGPMGRMLFYSWLQSDRPFALALVTSGRLLRVGFGSMA